MAGVPRGRARGGRLLNRFQGFMICFYCNRVSRRHFIRLAYHAYNFDKENKIVSGVSPRLPFAWPQVDRPSRLLSFARPPGSSARLVRLARPLGPWFVALLRTFQTIKYLSLLYYSPWHLTHLLGNRSCATTLYPTYPTYPTPCPGRSIGVTLYLAPTARLGMNGVRSSSL